MFTRILTPIVIAVALTQTANANLDLMRKEMDAFQKPMVASLKNTLEKDPEFTKGYKAYRLEMAEILKTKNEKERMAKIEAESKKYELLFDRAMKKAKVDPEHSKKKAADLSKKYSSKRTKYTLLTGKYLTYAMWRDAQAEQEQPPLETEQEFVAPFEFQHSVMNGGDVRADLEEGLLEASSNESFAAVQTNKAGFGMFLRMNWDAGRVRVSTRLGGVRYHVFAVSAGGGSGAKASSVIDLVTEDGDICQESVTHGEAIAPVLWHVSLIGRDTTVFACEMDAPPRNQDLAIRFQGVSEITAVGLASAISSITGTAQPIRARLLE